MIPLEKTKQKGRRKVARLEGEALEQQINQIKHDCAAGTLTIGETVRALRELTGLTQAEYAKMVKMSRSTLSNIENDHDGASIKSIREALRAFAFELRVMPKGPIRSEPDR